MLLYTPRSCNIKHFIGVDEAGRGPIAGPVAVGVVAINAAFPFSFFKGIRDSKQLSESQREMWALKAHAALDRGMLHYSVCFSTPQQIDRMGIVAAVEEALSKAIEAVDVRLSKTCVFLDGSLPEPSRAAHTRVANKGDEYEPLISLASVLAKVYRDHAMVKLARKYPHYGFDQHKGYGTRDHYEAIKEHGLCDLHRKSFITLTPDGWGY